MTMSDSYTALNKWFVLLKNTSRFDQELMKRMSKILSELTGFLLKS